MGKKQQQSFNGIKVVLIDATAVAQLDTEGEFVDADGSGVAISGFLREWERKQKAVTNCVR